MKKLMRATMLVLALGFAAAPWASAQACVISGGSDAQCIARCYKIKNFWEQTLCSLGAAPAPAPAPEAMR
ncbi:hypothetical protein GCM10019059_04010 [Camelimonas fluminis]|uniref:Lipoprotein n=1 Tax=Camelimonas fluminis TaxID=1576911 RepID=A0ABV7UC84_9HYPH|nr:hypothetical protein [Camelimonas fluminis]GHE48392.1 hypothetical protein GCM10019059_04010 [Camelimonas fluminis]